MEVIPQVHQLKVRRANAFLIAEEALTLVDSGMPGSAAAIFRFIHRLGRDPGELKQIIITHHHLDHMGSLAELKRLTGASVALHRAEVPYINGEQPPPSPFQNKFVTFLFSPLRPLLHTEPVPVDNPLEEGDELDILGGLKVLHTPGHTPGSISLFFPRRRLLLVGDAMNNRYNRLSLPPKMVSVDVNQARQSAERLASLDFDVLGFGHGRPIREEASKRVRRLLSLA